MPDATPAPKRNLLGLALPVLLLVGVALLVHYFGVVHD